MQTKAQNETSAEEALQRIRALVPACWETRIHNMESRPGHPPLNKIVASYAGLSVVFVLWGEHEGGTFVNIVNGPGPVETLSPRLHGKTTWPTPEAAVEALRKHMKARYDRIVKQATPFLF